VKPVFKVCLETRFLYLKYYILHDDDEKLEIEMIVQLSSTETW
jgi:hypothetical protein